MTPGKDQEKEASYDERSRKDQHTGTGNDTHRNDHSTDNQKHSIWRGTL